MPSQQSDLPECSSLDFVPCSISILMELKITKCGI